MPLAIERPVIIMINSASPMFDDFFIEFYSLSLILDANMWIGDLFPVGILYFEDLFFKEFLKRYDHISE